MDVGERRVIKGRILVIDEEARVFDFMDECLSGLGLEVYGVKDAVQVVPRAMSLTPELILVNRDMPLLNGAEIIRALRAFPQTFGVPVGFLDDRGDDTRLVRAVRSGAIDVLNKPLGPEVSLWVSELLEALRRTPFRGTSSPSQQAQTLLGIIGRQRRTGIFCLNPQTPFQGRMLFEDGVFMSAEFGPANGLKAVEQMLAVEDGVWRFDGDASGDDIREQARRAAESRDEEPTVPGRGLIRLLVVDDEPDIRKLLKSQLSRAGFSVDVAEDGREGVQMARGGAYDLVLADLNMPRLDGWGMLRELRADFRTRELPVIFLSAHEDYQETLKAAKSGAWDYLPKTGRAELIIQRTLKALLPRQRASAELLLGDGGELELTALGPRWVLTTLARHHVTGVLAASDAWASYRVALREGHLVSATATAPLGRTHEGAAALGALLVSHGATARFHCGPVEEQVTFTQPLEETLDTACDALNQLENKAVSSRIQHGGKVQVDTELYTLYRRVSSDRQLMIARAVCEQRVPPHDVCAHLGVPAEEVDATLADLLRRQVIRFEAEV